MIEPKITATFGERKIKASSVANTGRTPTVSGSQDTDSFLLTGYLRLLGFDPTISELKTEPVTLRWIGEDGKTHKYTPDILVRYGFGPDKLIDKTRVVIVEVKPMAVLKRKQAEFAERFEIAKRWTAQQGWEFKIVTEEDIPEIGVKNATFLTRFRKSTNIITPQTKTWPHRFRKTLKSLGTSTPDALLDALAENQQERLLMIPVLWHLIANKQMGVDLGKPLTQACQIHTLDQNTDFMST